jgi:hypothetical protein
VEVLVFSVNAIGISTAFRGAGSSVWEILAAYGSDNEFIGVIAIVATLLLTNICNRDPQTSPLLLGLQAVLSLPLLALSLFSLCYTVTNENGDLTVIIGSVAAILASTVLFCAVLALCASDSPQPEPDSLSASDIS